MGLKSSQHKTPNSSVLLRYFLKFLSGLRLTEINMYNFFSNLANSFPRLLKRTSYQAVDCSLFVFSVIFRPGNSTRCSRPVARGVPFGALEFLAVPQFRKDSSFRAGEDLEERDCSGKRLYSIWKPHGTKIVAAGNHNNIIPGKLTVRYGFTSTWFHWKPNTVSPESLPGSWFDIQLRTTLRSKIVGGSWSDFRLTFSSKS